MEGNFRKKEDEEEEREKDTQQGKTETEETMDEHRGFYNFNTPPEAEKSEVSMEENVVISVVVEESHCL